MTRYCQISPRGQNHTLRITGPSQPLGQQVAGDPLLPSDLWAVYQGRNLGNVFFLQKERHRKSTPSCLSLIVSVLERQQDQLRGGDGSSLKGEEQGWKATLQVRVVLGKKQNGISAAPFTPPISPGLVFCQSPPDSEIFTCVEYWSSSASWFCQMGKLRPGEGHAPKVIKEMLLIRSALLGFWLLVKWASHLLSVPHWKANRENSLVTQWERNWHTHCPVDSRGFHGNNYSDEHSLSTCAWHWEWGSEQRRQDPCPPRRAHVLVSGGKGQVFKLIM